ncbi:MAG: M20 family metallopeptidase [Firmicutes bacterium]|nr:M20 family metallopeptidase [Bacillota bacterium]
MNYQELKDSILDAVRKNHDELFNINCRIADNPELTGEEKESSKALVELLTSHGFKCEYPYGKYDYAFRAIHGENNHSHKVAILAEYDALAGLGHACGHSLSGSISCLAGIALSELQDELDTDIHVVGTPGEEYYSTKGFMVDDGLFDEYEMTIMVHLFNSNLPSPNVLALSAFEYEFFGKPAHSATAPWEGVNALNAAQLHLHAIDMARQHVKEGTRFHGIFVEGGTAVNIVPDYVKTRIYVRAKERDYKNELVEWVDRMAEGAALATGCTWKKSTKTHPTDDLRINKTGDKVLREVYAELGLEIGDESVIFASSDVGCVSYLCPTFQPCLKLSEPPINIHMREFEELIRTPAAEKALDEGALIIALHIIKIFSSPELIASLKADGIQ